MELKSYQRKVIENLEEYLGYVQEHKSLAKAFNQYWEDKIILLRHKILWQQTIIRIDYILFTFGFDEF